MRNNKETLHPVIGTTILVALLAFSFSPAASDKNSKVTGELTLIDNKFWQAYNTCDIETISTFLSEDVEFVQDKSGITRSVMNLLNSIKTNLCSDPNMRLRREAKSSEVYPIQHFGAIMTGEHVFHLSQHGKAERLDSKAQFMHLWHYNEGHWKLNRIVSYDHQITSENANIESLDTSSKVLSEYAGQYHLEQMGAVTVSALPDGLRISTQGFEANVYLETKDLFFNKARPLKFAFIRGGNGNILEMQVIENGQVIDSAKKL